MDVRTFLVTSKTFSGELVFEYDLNGVLKGFKNEAELSQEQIKYLCKSFPCTIDDLNLLSEKSQTMKVEEKNMDLSFENFWNNFDYKVGSKEKCRKLWEGLSKPKKIKCLTSIPAYNYFLKVKQIAKVYPERYISQNRYENDYKKLSK